MLDVVLMDKACCKKLSITINDEAKIIISIKYIIELSLLCKIYSNLLPYIKIKIEVKADKVEKKL